MTDTEYAYLKKRILDILSIDLEAYKSQQMRRRLATFVDRKDAGGIFRFARSLGQDPDIVKELKDMITINVTEFFRDATQFKNLEKTVLPQLLQDRTRLNIWAAGCSNGAEPYSIAMILDDHPNTSSHRILATDIDPDMISQAKAGGPYQANTVKNVSALRLRRHFRSSNGLHTVSDELRNRVQFREHNLLSDEFESGFDLVLCRNVVIYFTDETKSVLYQRFAQSLKPSGVLFLGATEALLAGNDASFERLSANFYRKSDTTARLRRAA